MSNEKGMKHNLVLYHNSSYIDFNSLCFDAQYHSPIDNIFSGVDAQFIWYKKSLTKLKIEILSNILSSDLYCDTICSIVIFCCFITDLYIDLLYKINNYRIL